MQNRDAKHDYAIEITMTLASLIRLRTCPKKHTLTIIVNAVIIRLASRGCGELATKSISKRVHRRLEASSV